jgi:hypothetical protein
MKSMALPKKRMKKMARTKLEFLGGLLLSKSPLSNFEFRYCNWSQDLLGHARIPIIETKGITFVLSKEQEIEARESGKIIIPWVKLSVKIKRGTKDIEEVY